MRRITTWALSTLTALVLLFSYHTSTSSSAAGVVAVGGLGGVNGSSGSGPASAGGAGSGGTSAATPTPTPTQGTGSSKGGTSGSSSGDGTYTGDAVMTQYGPVQVQLTVSGGRITKSAVTQVPWNDWRDQEINSYAVPVLNGEVVQAQSSQIDMVSGATFTSEGYIQSLQSAIDKAHL
jgi:uncharacterized protein with FMN-binding domain